jgi:hypothetical protein
MKLIFGIFFVIVLVFPGSTVANDSVKTRAQVAIANTIYPYAVAKAGNNLKSSGLPDAEIAEVTGKAGDGYALCLVEFMESRDEDEACRVLELTADGLEDFELETTMGEGYRMITQIVDAHRSVIDACWHEVDQELGIPSWPVE